MGTEQLKRLHRRLQHKAFVPGQSAKRTLNIAASIGAVVGALHLRKLWSDRGKICGICGSHNHQSRGHAAFVADCVYGPEGGDNE